MKVYLLVNPIAVENMNGCIEVMEEIAAVPETQLDILPRVNDNAINSTFYKILHEFLNEKQGFKDPNLSLETMSEQLSIPKTKLSNYLQECFGMNFPEVINRYRINYFIELYKKDDLKLMKVETLILQSGYRNKTTFYMAFKKVLKTKPSSFIKQSIN